MKKSKKLGQNFLTSKAVVSDIVKVAKIKPGEMIVEVGPGKGILTEALIKSKCKVIAIEKDEELVGFLKNRFKDEIKNNRLKLIKGDILNFNPNDYQLVASGYKIVANIPYYITAKFLRMFLGDSPSGEQPKSMILMLQKEVAERITNNKESILSLSVKAYGDPKIIKIVPAEHFSPKPKVNSAILAIENISKKFFLDINEKEFFKIIKQGFSHKRKLLKNNLELSNTECLTTCDINEKARAQELSLLEWRCLVGCINS